MAATGRERERKGLGVKSCLHSCISRGGSPPRMSYRCHHKKRGPARGGRARLRSLGGGRAWQRGRHLGGDRVSATDKWCLLRETGDIMSKLSFSVLASSLFSRPVSSPGPDRRTARQKKTSRRVRPHCPFPGILPLKSPRDGWPAPGINYAPPTTPAAPCLGFVGVVS